jgi:hypothetical protein
MNWDLEGLSVKATYLDEFTVYGKVERSRVKYGGTVQHTVVLLYPTVIYGQERDRLLIEHQDVKQVYSNLNEFI